MARLAAGRNFQARVMGNGAAAGAGTGNMRPADFIALTENNATPADANTTLTGELNAAGGGLNRAQATFAHTAGASSYTLTRNFTKNASDGGTGDVRTVRKMAVFNAATAGDEVFETLVTPEAALVSGDSVNVTETVSI